jgi:hypothetical protein
MARLEDLQQGAHVRGLDRSGIATVEAVSWVGEQAVKVIYRSASGALKDRLVYRDDEPTLELAAPTRQWFFDGDGDLLRLVSEANCILLAWLFDPFVAISSSLIRPLPHQISAVDEPLRFPARQRRRPRYGDQRQPAGLVGTVRAAMAVHFRRGLRRRYPSAIASLALASRAQIRGRSRFSRMFQ